MGWFFERPKRRPIGLTDQSIRLKRCLISAHEDERRRLLAALNVWGLRLSQRTTLSEQQMRDRRGKSQARGILIGVWDEGDVAPELWSRYLGEGG